MFETALLLLFQFCHRCYWPAPSVTKYVIGTFICICQKYDHCDARYVWESQPFIENIPAGNLLQSASILFSGALPEQALRMFQIIGCSTISRRTFHYHKKYLHPAIFHIWDRNQQAYFALLKSDDTPLIVGGDGTADSPGHSAKYGSYSLIELHHKLVFDIELVQISPTDLNVYA